MSLYVCATTYPWNLGKGSDFMRDREEKRLLQRLKKADTAALEEIMDIYTPYLYAVVSNVLGGVLGSEDAEEIVSDSFAALWYAREKIKAESLRAYLAAIARNRAKDRLRAMKISETLEEDVPVAECDLPERQALVAELSAIARSAVESLGEPDREIFKRHYFLYQKTDDISRDMGINAATVRTKLARGRQRLKDYLTERGFGCENLYI